MEIVLYPDPRLRRKNAPVEAFDAELARLARAMFDAMYRTRGVGLAAPQVGVNLRLLVYNPTGDPEQPEAEVVLCNPRLAWKARSKETGEEGCLSFPSIYAQVERPVAAKVEARDLLGEPVELPLEDWEARVFQHEFDHLDGILFIDRMSPADRLRIKTQLEDLEAAFVGERAGS
ncbi:MAG TPA: peptide deformylase [Planctomycetota bacterium]